MKTEAGAGTKALTVEAPSRFVVLPDFFADDMVVDATQIPAATAELPSENLLVHLLPDRKAIVVTVADSRDQDAKVTLSGKDAQRLIRRSEVYYGAGKVWVAVLEAPRHLVPTRHPPGRNRQNPAPGVDGAVSGPVARSTGKAPIR